MVLAWLKKFTRPAPRADRSAGPYLPRLTPRPAPEPALPPELIARRAYEKWLARGKPAGTSTQDWLEAEAELRAERQPNQLR